MKLDKHSIRAIFGALLVVAAFVSAVSCVAEREDDPKSGGRRTGAVRLGAYLEDVAQTRAQEGKAITSGIYYMTYPNASDLNTYSVCTVNFHDGFGFTSTWENKDLKWEEVGALTTSDTHTNFFLDNVAPPDENNPHATEIFFTESYHPFDAAVYDGDGGPNDLLWGSTLVDLYTSADISIGLHHNLSRVSVIVTVDNTLTGTQEIKFDQGSVKITNVIKKGKSFNRTNGRVSLGDDYEALELAVDGNWKSVSKDETEPNISYYTTQNFVLPPQALSTGEMRPRLVLDVPQSDGTIRSYSGVIPRVMMVDGSPATMAFDPEKNLTLRVKISQDKLRIESIVAYVQDWVNKGSFVVSANSAGILSDKDFLDLLAVYQTGVYNDIRQFGYLDTSSDGEAIWSFNIFTELRLDYDEVQGKMGPPAPDFRFDMTTWRFMLTYPDGTKRVFGSYEPSDREASSKAAKILHDLLRDGTLPDPADGIDPDSNNDGDGDIGVGVG